jgi:hypothetical protein
MSNRRRLGKYQIPTTTWAFEDRVTREFINKLQKFQSFVIIFCECCIYCLRFAQLRKRLTQLRKLPNLLKYDFIGCVEA